MKQYKQHPNDPRTFSYIIFGIHLTISDFDDIEVTTTTTAKEQQKSIFLKYMENRRSHRLWLLRMSSTMEFILMDNNLLTNSMEGRRVKELANHSKHFDNDDNGKRNSQWS